MSHFGIFGLLARVDGEGLYISLPWLVSITVGCGMWVMMLSWMGEDARRVGAPRQLWDSILFLVGLMALVLTLVLSKVFIITCFMSLIGIFGCYVWARNLLVPKEQQVFTPGHIRYLFRYALSKFGGAKLIEAKQRESKIILLRKDGKTLDAISMEKRSEVSESQAVVAVKEMIENAINSRATDIHLEPKENELQIRYRIDGILHNVPSYAPELTRPMVSAVKVLSDMDIAERRKPQDGTFSGKLDDRLVDFRCATSSSVHGETMSVRILDRDRDMVRLDRLGMDPRSRALFTRIINAPHGMLSVSGPTGSGKTTTLYAALSEIDAYQKNILTIENPIEYVHSPKRCQVTQREVGLHTDSFLVSLRAALREDPDIIMVGELRDLETQSMAITASETGHLVFATLHTTDAPQTINRIVDVFPPYQQDQIRVQLSFVLQIVFCQQLVTHSSGKGRVMAAETLVVNSAVRNLIREKKIEQIATTIQTGGKLGMQTMNASLVSLYLKGLITYQEAINRSLDVDDLKKLLARIPATQKG